MAKSRFKLPFKRLKAPAPGPSDRVGRTPRASYDVVVIGGGARALAIAWNAAERGSSVGLFSAGEIAAAADERAWPVIRAGNPDPLRMASDASASTMLKKFARTATTTIGRDPTGCLTFAPSAHEVTTLSAACERAKAIGAPAWMVPSQEVIALSPPLAGGADFMPALYEPDAVTIDPDGLAVALAQAAVDAGAELFCDVPAQALERASEGSAATGVLFGDRLVRAGAVALADDVSAIRLVREGKGRLSLKRSQRTLLVTDAGAPATGPALAIGEHLVTRNLAGALSISGPAEFDQLAAGIVGFAPSLSGIGVATMEPLIAWSGVDGRAQIGAAEIEGLWLCLGFGREAVGGALPAAAELVAQMAGEAPHTAFTPFAPTRRLSSLDRELLR